MPEDDQKKYLLAFVLGPFWYFANGMQKKGVWLFILCAVTFGLACPFVWIYCGFRAKNDYIDYMLKSKSKLDLSNL